MGLLLSGAGLSLLPLGMMGSSGPSLMSLDSRRSLAICSRRALGVAPGGLGVGVSWLVGGGMGSLVGLGG